MRIGAFIVGLVCLLHAAARVYVVTTTSDTEGPVAADSVFFIIVATACFWAAFKKREALDP
jgi:hypothetical protein